MEKTREQYEQAMREIERLLGPLGFHFTYWSQGDNHENFQWEKDEHPNCFYMSWYLEGKYPLPTPESALEEWVMDRIREAESNNRCW